MEYQWIQVQVTLDAGPDLGEGRTSQLMPIKPRPVQAVPALERFDALSATRMHHFRDQVHNCIYSASQIYETKKVKYVTLIFPRIYKVKKV